ncbi:MAG: hypothetical protein ABH919_03635 [bacterium]
MNIEPFISRIKKFFGVSVAPKTIKPRKRKKSRPKEKIVPAPPIFREEIKPMSGRKFLEQLDLPKKKEKTRKQKPPEEPLPEKKEKQRPNGKLIFMEEKGSIITSLADDGSIEFNRNIYLGKIRGNDIPRWIAKELKRAGITEMKVDGSRITVSPVAQQQLREIQKTLA